MPKVLNGVATFLCCVIPIWSWYFCFIKQLLVDSFGLRLYCLPNGISLSMIAEKTSQPNWHYWIKTTWKKSIEEEGKKWITQGFHPLPSIYQDFDQKIVKGAHCTVIRTFKIKTSMPSFSKITFSYYLVIDPLRMSPPGWIDFEYPREMHFWFLYI